jgi:hypothetical protein
MIAKIKNWREIFLQRLKIFAESFTKTFCKTIPGTKTFFENKKFAKRNFVKSKLIFIFRENEKRDFRVNPTLQH